MAARPLSALQLAPHPRGDSRAGAGCPSWRAQLGKVCLALEARTQLGEAIHPRPMEEGTHESFPLLPSSSEVPGWTEAGHLLSLLALLIRRGHSSQGLVEVTAPGSVAICEHVKFPPHAAPLPPPKPPHPLTPQGHSDSDRYYLQAV